MAVEGATANSESQPTPVETGVVVAGAGPAGLAVGACLRREGIPFVLLEQADRVGASWRRHYRRLHLHTDKRSSHLPFVPFGADVPRYPSREQVIAYLEAYTQRFALAPRFGQEVVSIRRASDVWEVRTRDARYQAPAVVVATGFARVPNRPAFPEQEVFSGPILHSSEYVDGKPFRGQRVLVVGLGNSGGEIAIDLHEHGARPAIAVRGPVSVLPRDLLGIPIVAWARPLSPLPPRVADLLAAPLLRLALGDVTRLGLARPPSGPISQIVTRGRIPLIDVGTLDLVRRGEVELCPGVERFAPDGVVFVDGTWREFDAVILATGYRPGLDSFLGEAAVGTEGQPALPGLFFCGYRVAPTGMLREIAIEAKQIARRIAQPAR